MPNLDIMTDAGLKALVERLGWADVRGYGATGNGTTDDTAAIAAAIKCRLPASPGGAP